VIQDPSPKPLSYLTLALYLTLTLSACGEGTGEVREGRGEVPSPFTERGRER